MILGLLFKVTHVLQIILEMRTAEPLQKECSDDNQKVCNLLNVVGVRTISGCFFLQKQKIGNIGITVNFVFHYIHNSFFIYVI